MGRKKVDVAGRPLTAGERQAVECLLMGKTNDDCSEVLRVSTRTLEVHRQSAMRKLEITSPVQLGYVFGYAHGRDNASPVARSPHPLDAPPLRRRRTPLMAAPIR